MTTDFNDLRALHSRITDNENAIELHGADIAALSASMQSLAKRLNAVEELLAYHCGFEVNDLRSVAAGLKDGTDSHELGACDDDHCPDIGDMVVPLD